MTGVTWSSDSDHSFSSAAMRLSQRQPIYEGRSAEFLMANRFQIVPRRIGGIIRNGHLMRAPYGLEIIESCITCPHREDRLFCDLPPEALRRLALITSASFYPKGATPVVEGQTR